MKIEHWFTAIVENIADPLNAGRVQIRCFDYHEQNNIILPSEKLPWATPLMPITSANLGGIGSSPTGLQVGSWVFGFFRDVDQQDPVIINNIGGIVANSSNSSNSTTSRSASPATAAAANKPKTTNPSPTKNGVAVNYDEFINATPSPDIGNRSPVGGDDEFGTVLPPLPGTVEYSRIQNDETTLPPNFEP